MDGAVNATATAHVSIGCVDDHVDGLLRDVAVNGGDGDHPPILTPIPTVENVRSHLRGPFRTVGVASPGYCGGVVVWGCCGDAD